jgi:hypothetical protein
MVAARRARYSLDVNHALGVTARRHAAQQAVDRLRVIAIVGLVVAAALAAACAAIPN